MLHTNILSFSIYVLCLQNVYYPSPRNPNLIAIVPVDEPSPLQQAQPMYPIEQAEAYPHDQGRFIVLPDKRIAFNTYS